MDPTTVSIILTTVGWLAKPIFNKAIDITWQQFTKKVGIHAETEELIAKLKSFKVPIETPETTKYLKEIKELISEAKDLLDELDYFRLQDEVRQKNKAEKGNILHKFKLHSTPSDVPGSSTKGTFKELKFDKKGMALRMKELIKKLEQTCEYLNPTIQHQLLSSIVHSIQIGNNQTLPTNRQETTSYPLEDKIYGRDSEIEQIKNLINHAHEDPQKLCVISLVGHGGVGKTTLAQQVFQHPTIKFDHKIWICVSTNLDEMGITRQMLQCCSPNNVSYGSDLNEDLLKRKLEEHLKEKTFFLVLDDIWEMSETQWKSLLAPLKNNVTNNIGSMVLVTTRVPTTAKMVSTTEPIYLNRLDGNSLWSFFVKCAFGDDTYKVPIVLENIGRKIIERLGGNPLATKTVGKILKDKNDKTWAEVLESETWKYLGEKDDIVPILRLSYEKLPIHLKQCFSYCSLFPKDYYFTAEDLVYMWMAQDFINTNDERVKNIHHNKNKSVEDVGFEYLNILVEGAFFQKVVTYGDDVKYVMHDLMHDLAQVVSIDETLAINHDPEHPLYPPNLCHLSFPLYFQYTIENHDKFRNLFSFVICKDVELREFVYPTPTLNWHQENKFRLRLLILPFVNSVSYSFTHLRYLKLYYSFNDTRKATFPVQICRLYHLEVLELDDQRGLIKELPKEFNNLVKLRHFIANEELHSEIAGVGRLKCLQELKKFVVREKEDFHLGQLSELKELRGSLEILSLPTIIRKKEIERVRLTENKIDNLKLYWDKETGDKPQKNRGMGQWRTWLNGEGRECRTTDASAEEILEALQPNSKLRHLRIENYGGCKSPSWLTNHSIKYLEYICLSNCEGWKELPNFGELVFLNELYLDHLPRVKALGPQFHGYRPQEGFPSLKVMHVTNMDELETWDWGKQCNVFPSLKQLCVIDCYNLVKFSLLDLILVHGENTKWFPMLDTLIIRNCPQLQQCSGYLEYLKHEARLMINHVKDPEVLAFMFRSLKNICSIYVEACPKVTSSTWKSICMIHGLKELKFKGCHKLCFLPPIEEENDDANTFYTHESLQVLQIAKCGVNGEELSYLFAHLPTIRELSIISCNMIGSVSLPSIMIEPNRASLDAKVEVEKDEQRNPYFMMCLEWLYIADCPNMVFVNEGGLSALTALKEVTICASDKLLSSMFQKQGSNYVHNLRVRDSNVTFMKLYNCLSLRCMHLYDCKYLASVESSNLSASLDIDIQYCPLLATTSSQIVPKFSMPMEKLKIDKIEFLSIHVNSFSMSLHSLTINDIYWNEWTEEQEDVVIKRLTALEELTLSWCGNLSSLPSTLHLHPSLKELIIDHCPKINSLPEWGFPKSLQKLRLSDDCSRELQRQCSQLNDFEYSFENHGWRQCYLVFPKKDLSVNGHYELPSVGSQEEFDGSLMS